MIALGQKPLLLAVGQADDRPPAAGPRADGAAWPAPPDRFESRRPVLRRQSASGPSASVDQAIGHHDVADAQFGNQCRGESGRDDPLRPVARPQGQRSAPGRVGTRARRSTTTTRRPARLPSWAVKPSPGVSTTPVMRSIKLGGFGPLRQRPRPRGKRPVGRGGVGRCRGRRPGRRWAGGGCRACSPNRSRSLPTTQLRTNDCHMIDPRQLDDGFDEATILAAGNILFRIVGRRAKHSGPAVKPPVGRSGESA